MLDRKQLNDEYKKLIQEGIKELKHKYEDLMLDMLHSEIENITKNFITAKRLVETIEGIEKAEADLTKLIKEKEEGEKENETKLNA